MTAALRYMRLITLLFVSIVGLFASAAYGFELRDNVQCALVPKDIRIKQDGDVFRIQSELESLSRYHFSSREAAQEGLESFEYHEFSQHCTVVDASGSTVFSYFLSDGMPPRYHEKSIESCSGFWERQTKVVQNFEKNTYTVKSGRITLVEDIADVLTAKVVLNLIDNYVMNARCEIKGSNFVYWKSLFNPIPPGSQASLLKLDTLRWEVNNLGFHPYYELTVADATRLLPFSISFQVENQQEKEVKLTLSATLSTDPIGQSELLLAPKEKKTITYKNDMIMSRSGSSKKHSVLVQAKVENGEVGKFLLEDSFGVHVGH